MPDTSTARLIARNKLLLVAVDHLRGYGHKAANVRNITSDERYRKHFRNMLEGNRGMGPPHYDSVIDELLAEIDRNEERRL